jgi:hypothetical protein
MYYSIEPWGQPEDDLQHSFTRVMLLESQGMKRKDKQPFNITDFSLNKAREKAASKNYGVRRKQTPEEMKQILMSIASYQNKTSRKQRKG